MAFLLLACALALPPLPVSAQTGDAAPVSARIRAVTEGTGEGGVPARIVALRALRGRTLGQSEIDALWAFLAMTAEEAKLSMERFNHLRNDTLTVLVQHSPAVPDLVPRLCAMYRDKAQDRTWRDYCIQFLGQAYPAASEADRGLALSAILEAAENRSLPTAGTALIALSNNLDAPGIGRDQVVEAAVAITADPDASPGARMTAFAVCGRLGAAEALPHARRAAAGETAQSVNVRMAAIAAIGVLGDDSDRELLGRLGGSAEPRLRRPAAAALRRLGGEGRLPDDD
jgi:hypothetical protein